MKTEKKFLTAGFLFCGALMLATVFVLGRPPQPPPEPPAFTMPAALSQFAEAYSSKVLPVGSLIQVQGSFETLSLVDGAPEGAPPQMHHSGTFTCAFQIGIPDKIYFRCKNLTVPFNPGDGSREHSIYDVEVFCDGVQWTELKYGSRYQGDSYRSGHEATIRPLTQASWYPVSAATGQLIFPLNASFGNESLPKRSDPELSTLSFSQHADHHQVTVSPGSQHIQMKLRPDFTLTESTVRREFSSHTSETHYRYSDYRETKTDETTRVFPYRVDISTVKDGQPQPYGFTQVDSITLLPQEDAETIFQARIPNGWRVKNEVTNQVYQQGDPAALRMLKRLFD